MLGQRQSASTRHEKLYLDTCHQGRVPDYSSTCVAKVSNLDLFRVRRFRRRCVMQCVETNVRPIPEAGACRL
eukprot:6609977-Heterocapsa_arctica.AAC.1